MNLCTHNHQAEYCGWCEDPDLALQAARAQPTRAPLTDVRTFRVGDRVTTADGYTGAVTHIDPPKGARFHVHVGKGFGSVYTVEDLEPAIEKAHGIGEQT